MAIDDNRTHGALGLTFLELDDVIQAMGRCLVDRGHDEDELVARLRDYDFDAFWMQVAGPAVDALAREVGLPPFPDED